MVKLTVPSLLQIITVLRSYRDHWRGKKALVGIIVAIEIGAYGCYYLLSPSGIQAVWRLNVENSKIQTNIKQLQEDILAVKQEIKEWQEYPWLQEKKARQELQMMYPGEQIFLID